MFYYNKLNFIVVIKQYEQKKNLTDDNQQQTLR